MEVNMVKQLPERADFEHLKGQAKALLQSLRSGDAEALARAGEAQSSYRLADAQRIVAREYGFPSWTKLKRHVEGFADRRAAFWRALRGGDRDSVGALLDVDPSLLHSHDDEAFGAPVITIAAERDDRPLIDLLLDRGADVNARSTWWAGGFGAIDLASEATSQYLLSRGAKLTAHAAARLGYAKELREIVANNPDVVCERGGDGQYPLHFSKTPEIVDILVDAGAELDARDLDHVSTAAQFRIKEADVCRRLLERGATPDVYIALMLQDIPLLERLIDEDPECLSRMPTDPGNPMIPEAPGMPIYTYTIGLGRPFQVAQAFYKASASEVIERRSSPRLRLLSACWRGDEAAAKALADQVKDLSSKDMSILAEAAWTRRLKAVKLMLGLGFDPDATGVHHSSPLDRAAFHGFDDVIEAILPFGPSLTIENEFGGTPLSACVYGSLHSWRKDGNFARSVQLLLDAGSPKREKMRGSPEVNAVLEKHGITIG
jgi:ankyrin repeat protein